MARGVNKVIIIGNCGGDPESRVTNGGHTFTNVTIATSESWKDKQSGEQKERTEWHRVVFSGKLAEIAGQYLKKGSRCYIEGKLQTREWEKDGVKRYTTEIVVDSFNGVLQLLGGKSDGGQPQPRQSAPQQSQQSAMPDDSDIPFAPLSYMAGI